MNESKDRNNVSGFEKELRTIKIEYSESLKETNMLLQKYKKLEEVHQEAISEIEYIRADHDKLNKKYLEIYREKNKLCDELNSSYDQINKLNMVLMSKEEQISRNKAMHCPHFESKPAYSSTRDMYNPSSQRNRSPLSKVESSFMYRKSNPYNWWFIFIYINLCGWSILNKFTMEGKQLLFICMLISFTNIFCY